MTGPNGGYRPPSPNAYPINPVPVQPGPPVRPAAYRPGQAQPPAPGWAPPGAVGSAPPPAAPPRRRGRLVLWLVLGGVVGVLLVVAAIVAVPILLGANSDARTTVSAPARVGGLTRQPPGSELTDVSLSASDLHSTVAGVYQGAAGTPGVYLYGGLKTDAAPQQAPDTFLDSLTGSGLTISGRQVFDDGTLDGYLKCATAVNKAQQSYGVCVWSNHGGLVATISPGRTPAQLAGVTRAMLPDVVKLG